MPPVTLIAAHAAVGFALGTVAHEVVHLLAVLVSPAEVVGVGVSPPRVVFAAANPGVDAWIRGSVWLVWPVIAVALWWAAGPRLASTVAWSAAMIGYLPRSPGDWAALRELPSALSPLGPSE